jgi:hypothetical protein
MHYHKDGFQDKQIDCWSHGSEEVKQLWTSQNDKKKSKILHQVPIGMI